MSWNDFNRFTDIVNRYMPDYGEGDTLASQVVTSVNKLIYKWFNDGDVFDNTHSMEGWANDLSNYANWLYEHAYGCDEILDGIVDCYCEEDYEGLLMDLAELTLNLPYLGELATVPCEGSIYNCAGPFKFEDNFFYEDEDEYE